MTLDVSLLLAPLTVRGKTLRNRIVMPPMAVARGIQTPAGIAWYAERARGGVGLVIVEATNAPDVGTLLSAVDLAPLVAAIHAGGALAALQLFPGRRGGRSHPCDLTQIDPVTLVADYARAAATCRQAGFDGVEVHGAHGYALNQFFSPELNQRDDAYGAQSLANRSHLALRIVRAMRPRLGEMLLLYRHTPIGAGYGLEDSRQLATALIEAGVDILDLSPSSVDYPGDRAAPFKDLGVPLIAVNDLDVVERAVEVLREGRADLVAVGRGLIADPLWPTKVREGRLEEIVTCIKCDGCFDDLWGGRPVGCTQWAD